MLSFVVNANVLTNANEYRRDTIPTNAEMVRIENQIEEVREIIKTNVHYNAKIAFFVDMQIKSGKFRFFVYDLIKGEVIDKGLVAHGSGSETNIKGNLKFSNEPNSRSTSLGRYSIGKSYKGMFGKAYKLSGLDATNNNAEKRAIVLHSYSAVPSQEQDYYISNSQGCPMINEDFFKRLEKIIDSSKSKIILNIYY
ncbi:hypothetical protein OA93_18725 [Flavobacterium sp. KMS]|nr:hypothetical protein OA93_18725 [Flavobacterium sp. KMS]